MRILMACAAFPPFIDGGGPISAMMVAKLLLAAGHDLEVVNVSGEDKREIFQGVPVRRLPATACFRPFLFGRAPAGATLAPRGPAQTSESTGL